jgi:hypothetical protein
MPAFARIVLTVGLVPRARLRRFRTRSRDFCRALGDRAAEPRERAAVWQEESEGLAGLRSVGLDALARAAL